MAKKPKWYVVLKGVQPGVYTSWDECKAQTIGFQGAHYKSFETAKEAEAAWKAKKLPMTPIRKTAPAEVGKIFIHKPIKDSFCVDAAWNTATGAMEYRGIYYGTGEEIFHQGPHPDGTNNVGEFLAIVHALAWCRKNNYTQPIYSDSMNAIAWVRKKQHGSKLERTGRNDILFDLLERAETWLRANTYSNKVLKWETRMWGENPADFGRK